MNSICWRGGPHRDEDELLKQSHSNNGDVADPLGSLPVGVDYLLVAVAALVVVFQGVDDLEKVELEAKRDAKARYDAVWRGFKIHDVLRLLSVHFDEILVVLPLTNVDSPNRYADNEENCYYHACSYKVG